MLTLSGELKKASFSKVMPHCEALAVFSWGIARMALVILHGEAWLEWPGVQRPCLRANNVQIHTLPHALRYLYRRLPA